MNGIAEIRAWKSSNQSYRTSLISVDKQKSVDLTFTIIQIRETKLKKKEKKKNAAGAGHRGLASLPQLFVAFADHCASVHLLLSSGYKLPPPLYD